MIQPKPSPRSPSLRPARLLPLLSLLSTLWLGCAMQTDDYQPPSTCPAEDPLGVEQCQGEFSCEYGTESCRGETFPSLICECIDGELHCYNTDACYHPEAWE